MESKSFKKDAKKEKLIVDFDDYAKVDNYEELKNKT